MDRRTFTFPKPVGPRLFGRCDVPDLELLPLRYPDARTVSFHAGFVSESCHKALEWIVDANPHTLSIYSAGNHDFYSFFDKNRPELKTTYERERDAMRRRAEQLGIIFLDNDSYILPDGTRILGGTGWTDFMLRPSWLMYGDAVRGATGAGGMNDYRCIKREPKPGLAGASTGGPFRSRHSICSSGDFGPRCSTRQEISIRPSGADSAPYLAALVVISCSTSAMASAIRGDTVIASPWMASCSSGRERCGPVAPLTMSRRSALCQCCRVS